MDEREKLLEFIKKGKEILANAKKAHEEMLNDPNLPEDLRDDMINFRKEYQAKLDEEDKRFEEYQEKNKGKKIIGYSIDNFWPIYED